MDTSELPNRSSRRVALLSLGYWACLVSGYVIATTHTHEVCSSFFDFSSCSDEPTRGATHAMLALWAVGVPLALVALSTAVRARRALLIVVCVPALVALAIQALTVAVLVWLHM